MGEDGFDAKAVGLRVEDVGVREEEAFKTMEGEDRGEGDQREVASEWSRADVRPRI